MFKKITIIIFSVLLYQNPLLSKSTSSNEFSSRNLSKYFSGIVAFDNKKNSEALDFFRSSKILMNQHDPYLEKFVISLVLEDKVLQAINIIKVNKTKNNSNFFEAFILLALDSLKKNDINRAEKILSNVPDYLYKDQIKYIILESLKQYVDVFKNKKLLKKNKNFGNLSLITEAFQRCYLDDKNTDSFFSDLVNNSQADYSRYIFFYISFLIEKSQMEKVVSLTKELDYINTSLLLSQGKSWIEENNFEEFDKVFSCYNHNDILAEFLFLVSNLYSSQDEFKKSNFYLGLSYYLNPKFVFNLSLVVENLYLNKNYEKSKAILKNFDRNKDFYHWYRFKKEAQIISKTRDEKEALNFIVSKFNKIKDPNHKFLFDIANFYRSAKEYTKAIKYYTIVIDSIKDDNNIKANLLYRRGGCYERTEDYLNADKDLQYSLKINPNDAYVLNYLAYSWLERDFKINKAIEMLENAYTQEKNDPYIIDSIGWAYYLTKDFIRAEKLLKRAVELMPDDPIVNDHYGDILWKLERKIQARYFWSIVLEMENIEKELVDRIQNKFIFGPETS